VERVDAARVSSWLASTEAATMGQHAARASPSDAASSMQQPQSLRERELEAEVQMLKAKLEATAKIAAQPPDLDAAKHPPNMERFAEFQRFEGVLKELKDLQDNALRSLFTEYAKDAVPAAEASTPDIKCLSKKDLAELFNDKYGVSLSEGKLEELISRSDTNGDGVINLNEFRTLVRSTSDLEMFFKSLPLAQVLAFCFPKGSAAEPLEALFNQQHSEVDAAMGQAGQILTGLTMSMIEKNNKARVAATKQEAAGGAKYGAELKGGTVEKFFEGITGICGEPHPGVCVCVCVCVCENELSCVT
jgi:hypothetical protein